METIADLIEAARKRTGATYTDISERLDRSKQLITNWKSGKKVPTDGDVLALARMAGENADKWLAIAQAARTEGEAKTRWEQIARRLGMAAMTLVVWVGLASPTPVQAAEPGVQAPHDVYIMRNSLGLTSWRGLAGYGSGSPLASLLGNSPKTTSRHDRYLPTWTNARRAGKLASSVPTIALEITTGTSPVHGYHVVLYEHSFFWHRPYRVQRCHAHV